MADDTERRTSWTSHADNMSISHATQLQAGHAIVRVSAHEGWRALDDDELIRHASNKIAEWKAAGTLPSLTAVQRIISQVDLRRRQCNGSRQDH